MFNSEKSQVKNIINFNANGKRPAKRKHCYSTADPGVPVIAQIALTPDVNPGGNEERLLLSVLVSSQTKSVVKIAPFSALQ